MKHLSRTALSSFALILILSVLFPLQSCSGGYAAFSDTRFDYFDTVCTLTAYAPSRSVFESAAEDLFAAMEEYDRLFDIYNAYDGLNNLKTVNDRAGEPVEVSDGIIELLAFSLEMYGETGGALNVMIGALSALWHRCREEGVGLPTAEELCEASLHVSPDSLIIDQESRTVQITDPDASVDVGALAKGWVARKLLELLPESGLYSAIIDLGGNVATYGAKPDGSSWRVAIDTESGDYLKVVEVSGLSVVTSGDYQRFYVVDGVKYHHIIDPETRRPAEKNKQVSVICSDPALGDALSTALFILDSASGSALVQKYGVYALGIDADGNVFEYGEYPENAENGETSPEN